MPTITELLEERGKIEKTLHALVDTAEAENRDLSAEEDEQFQRLIDDDKSLKTRIDRIERTERLASELNELRNHGIDRDECPASAAGEMPDEPDEQRDQTPQPDDDCRAIQAWLRRGQSLPLDGVSKAACERLNFNPANRRQIIQGIDTRTFRRLQSEFRHARPDIAVRNLSTGGVAGWVPEGFINQLELALLAFGGMLHGPIPTLLKVLFGELRLKELPSVFIQKLGT